MRKGVETVVAGQRHSGFDGFKAAGRRGLQAPQNIFREGIPQKNYTLFSKLRCRVIPHLSLWLLRHPIRIAQTGTYGRPPYNVGTPWQHTMALEGAAAIQYVIAEAEDFSLETSAGTLPNGRGSADWRLGRWHVTQTGRFAAETDGFAQAVRATLGMVVRSFRKPLFINEIPVPKSSAYSRVNLGNPIAFSGVWLPSENSRRPAQMPNGSGRSGSR
jgi:hypothetical protein